MEPKTTQIGLFEITYFCKEELNILKQEIFKDQIYKIDLLSKKPHILDVGSHIGLSIIYFKSLYPNSTIIGFEPNPNVFPLLEENIFLNNIEDVELYNIALGREEKVRELYIDSSGYGAFSTSSFYKNAWNGKQQTIPIQVSVKKLSHYIKGEIDLLKLDSEGAELEILEELEDSKKIDNVKNIILEFHPTSRNKYQKIQTLLKQNNFQIEERNKDEEGLILVVGKKLTN
mgnify:CR=1 FL=1